MKQKRSTRCWHWWSRTAAVDLLFRLFFPVLARLPRALGMRMAARLGDWCRRLDIDWRTVALREHFVAERTAKALLELLPKKSAAEREAILQARFRNAAQEELEGHWFPLGIADNVNCRFENIEAIESCLAAGSGMVLITLHFDATLMGVVQLGRRGLKLNLMTSSIVEDPRVLRSVKRYFARKYTAIQTYLNGGRCLHVENGLRAFYRGIRCGESTVLLCEGSPPAGQDSINVHFLGRLRATLPGAIRIAEKTGAPMAAFVCLREVDGSYRVTFSPVCRPQPNEGHAPNAPTLFGFLDEFILRQPERWWAADLLPNYRNLD